MKAQDGNRIEEFISRSDLKMLILEVSPCGIVVVNKKGYIIAYNNQLKKHWSVRHLELINRKIEDILPRSIKIGQTLDHVELLYQTLKTRSPFCGEVDIWMDSKDYFVCKLWIRPLLNDQGQLIGACSIYYDLTPFRKQKQQLENLSRALADTGVQAVNQYMETIKAFANAIAARDSYTRWHSEKVAEYAQQICFNMGMSGQVANQAYLAGLLHDVGKIGVPEAILNKPGKLSDDEYELIKKHPEIGVEILASMRNMQDILHVIKHHHERYDGRGYPDNLIGNDIPLLSRVLAVADSFEAMTSNRSYRQAFPMDKAMFEIKNNMGTQFDPLVAQSFIELVEHKGFNSC